jgi:hypothetical protein
MTAAWTNTAIVVEVEVVKAVGLGSHIVYGSFLHAEYLLLLELTTLT